MLWVSDVDRSVRFYCDVLGFEVKTRYPNAAFLRIAGSSEDHHLGLFAQPGVHGVDEGAVRMYHSAWEVGELTDLVRARKRLIEAGSLVGSSDHGVSLSLYAKDPDGLEFEVFWTVPGWPLGGHPRPRSGGRAVPTRHPDAPGDRRRSVHMTCSGCRFEAPADFAFCPKCGARLAGAPAPPPPPSPPAAPEGDRRPVTVLFADLAGFTALSEGLDPEDVRAIQADLFREMSASIERYEGFVEKFVGDAVMAVFGAPRAHEDDPERGLRAALLMRDRMGALNAAGSGGWAGRSRCTSGSTPARWWRAGSARPPTRPTR